MPGPVRILILLVAAGVAASPWAYAAAPLRIPLDEGWRLRAEGPWAVRQDPRALIAMQHPWQPSVQGSFAAAARRLSVPADWVGPVYIAFYVSDTYQAVRESAQPGESGVGFVGHRMKQLLVDGEVVWSADVADAAGLEARPRIRVQLPVQPGDTFLLSVLAYDAVSSTVTREENFSVGDVPAEAPHHFMTQLYWGDFVLLDGDTAAPEGARPSEPLVRRTHEARWPIAPADTPWPSDTVDWVLQRPRLSLASGMPLRQGVPFARGQVNEPDAVRLEAGDGEALYAQKRVLATWPDGSIRWLLLDALLPAEVEAVRLRFQTDRARAPRGLEAETNEAGPMLSGGGYTLAASTRALAALTAADGVARNITLALDTPDGTAAATPTAARLTEAGPLRATLEVDARLDGFQGPAGRVQTRIARVAGTPLVRLHVRWFNDTPAPVPLRALRLRLPLATPPDTLVSPFGEDPAPVSYAFTGPGTARVGDVPVPVEGPFFVAWADGALAWADAPHRYPVGVAVDESGVTLDLAAGGDAPVVVPPGAALSHVLWWCLEACDGPALAALAEAPPHLSHAAYTLHTGVLGPARPLDTVAQHARAFAGRFAGRTLTEMGYRSGLRAYPERPFLERAGTWSLGFYARPLNLGVATLATNDAAWHHRFDTTVRHLLDAAVVHSEVPGTDWLGALRGPGPPDSAPPWPPGLRTEGYALHHYLTGEPASMDAVLSVADYIVRTRAGIEETDPRAHASALAAILTALEATGDLGFLDEASLRVAALQEFLEVRRGVWPQAQGSAVDRRMTPWHAAHLARPLYRWYRQTGDLAAAQTLVALADGVRAEHLDWQDPTRLRGVLGNPRLPETSAHDPFILPLFFAAHELTGDAAYLNLAAGVWERWHATETLHTYRGTFWYWPWLMEEVAAHQLAGTPPLGEGEGTPSP